MQRFLNTYTRDLRPEDLPRLFTRDARDAYRFFARGLDFSAVDALPWHRRLIARARLLFLAFAMRLSPARRLVYGVALLLAAIGALKLFRGFHLVQLPFVDSLGWLVALPIVAPEFREGTGLLLLAFALVNLLVLLEVVDRLTLKNDLEIARDIQQAMLPAGPFVAPGIEIVGSSRPANTVGGDFYDILPLPDGRVVLALGDVAGKGSPAALLMALLLAMLRTLAEENLEPATLMARLNVQVCRRAPVSRFTTMFYGLYDPSSGTLTYVNAGHPPPLVVRAGGIVDRLGDGGIALGMFERSTYRAGRIVIGSGEIVAVYSDGITEAEDPAGRPFDERGLEAVLARARDHAVASLASAIVGAVEQHRGDTHFADDLTILLLRRVPVAAPAVIAV